MPKRRSLPSTKRGSRKREIFFTFLIFFLVFGFVGYLQGRSLRNKPERLLVDILPRLAIGENKGQKAWVYQCNGESLATWLVDDDKLSSHLIPSDTNILWPSIFDNNAVMTAFLTGSGIASVFSARELLSVASKIGKVSKGQYLRLMVSAIAGAVSGYELGNRIALSANSDCADPRFSALLIDPKKCAGKMELKTFGLPFKVINRSENRSLTFSNSPLTHRP